MKDLLGAVRRNDATLVRQTLAKAESVTQKALWYNELNQRVVGLQGRVGGVVEGVGAGGMVLSAALLPFALVGGVVGQTPALLVLDGLLFLGSGLVYALGDSIANVNPAAKLGEATSRPAGDLRYVSIWDINRIVEIAQEQQEAQFQHANQDINIECPSNQLILDSEKVKIFR